MAISKIDTLTTKYNTLGEMDNAKMNASAPTIRVPDTPEKALHHDFTMVPNILLDPNEHVIESHMLGFIRFMRKFGGRFVGSLGKLARGLKMVKTTVSRMIDAWKNGGLVTIEQAEEDMQIMACNLWAMNEERYPRSISSAVSNCNSSGVADCNSSANSESSAVADCNSAIANRNSAVAQSSTNSGVILHTNTTEEESVIPTESVSEDISSTPVDDALPPYEDGLKPRKSILADWLADMSLMDDAFLAEMEKLLPPARKEELSTPVIPNVDNHYHIAPVPTSEPMPISKEAAPPTEQPPAVQKALQVGATPKGAQAASPPARETRKRGVVKKADDVPALCDAREVHQRINDRRGYALEESIDIIRENKAIKTWAHLHTIEQFDPVMDYLQERDPFWSKSENKHRIGGVTFLKETPRVLALLAKRKPQNGASSRLGVSGHLLDVPLTDKPLPVIIQRNQPKRGYA